MKAKENLNVDDLEFDPDILQNTSNLLKPAWISSPGRQFMSKLLYFCTYQNPR